MSHLHNRIQLLKNPPFLSYAVGFLCAAFGNGLGYIAISWIVVSNHGGGVWAMSILMLCFWTPNVFLSPFMGVLADRLSKKTLIIISNFVRACIFILFGFYFSTHFININLIYSMMLCIGISFSIFYASALSFIRELVAEKDLIHANSTMDIMYEAGNLLGMGFAGLLIAWTSAQTAILINGIAFIIATLSVMLIPASALCHGKTQPKKRIQLFNDLKDGLRYLFSQKKLLSIYTIQLLIFMTYLTMPLLLVPFSKIILHATVTQFGLIEASASIGIVIGGLFMPWIGEKWVLLKTILFFSAALCTVFLIFGYNRSIDLAIGLYFIIGFSGAIWPLIISKAQSLTDFSFQGRVQSTFNSLSGSMTIVFYLSIGWISTHWAIQHLYLIYLVRNILPHFHGLPSP